MTEKEFERIYNSLWSKLYGIAYSYFRDRITAQEVTQDVFVNLWLKRDSLSPIQDLEAYLLRSVKNRIYNQFEKIHAKEKLEKSIIPTMTVQTENTEEAVVYSDTLEVVNHEIDQLPAMTKTVFRLSRFDRYTNNEIADRLQLSGKAVEYHITRALKRLRLRLNIF
ncbi:MAG TPA: RNA polymerase sigma-70 factor [Chryseolinea sp.]